ncbi:MAG: PEGA domain-containing protein [Vicinamibacterales bacterium]
MTRRAITLWTAAAALTLTVSPAWARQAKERPEPSRPSNGNETGSAVARPSGGSGGSSGGSSSSSSPGASSGGDMSVRAPRGESSGNSSSGMRAPERRGEARERAVQRGEANGRSATAEGRTSASAPSGNGGGVERRAIPAYSRPRDGRTPVGSAAERVGPPPNRGGDRGNYGSYYDPYYYGNFYGYGNSYGYGSYNGYGYGNYGYGRWMPGYGFGLGYFYDPFAYGMYSPYDTGYGYGGGYGGQGYSQSYGRSRATGQLRLKVKPEHGQVYVDGYYVGDVDSFDGVFQRMPIEAGTHRVEIRAAGFQPVTFDVMVIAGETVTFKGELRRVQ